MKTWNKFVKKCLRRSQYTFYFVKFTIKSYFDDNLAPADLLLESQILVNTERKITLLWTPKVGSHFAVKWFFDQKGLLKKALNYHSFYYGNSGEGFVHNFRDEVYRFSEEHRVSVGQFLQNPDEYIVIKIVRQPLERAVSSFIHANKYGFADKSISKFLRRKVTRENRFSFREFVSYLESLDIYKCNIHFRAQIHRCERNGQIRVGRVIDLSNSINLFSNLEKELGLKSTDLEKLAQSKHHTIRKNVDGFYGDKIDLYGLRGIPVPPARNFYDNDLINCVGEIYKEDFERYGYKYSLSEI